MHPWLETITGFANAAASFLYPEHCQLCNGRRAAPIHSFVCVDCRAAVTWIEAPFCDRCGYPYEANITTTFECKNCKDVHLHFSTARSAVAAKGGVLEAIHRYKYQRALWFEPFLAGLLVNRAFESLRDQGWTRVVPVPLYSTKEREREFNQSERLGRHLAKALELPLDSSVLKRSRPTRTQTRLSREERQENMRNAFILSKTVKLDDERIVLVDDVFTTGATTAACAKVLRAAGAADVCVWTVARGI